MSHQEASFSAAVAVLAGNGHIKQRLVQAYSDNLQHLDEGSLPVPMKQRFADLKGLMECVAPLNGEGPVRASVRKMSVDDADRCARLMVTLYGDIVRFGNSGKSRVSPDIEPAVPPFLVKSG